MRLRGSEPVGAAIGRRHYEEGYQVLVPMMHSAFCIMHSALCILHSASRPIACCFKAKSKNLQNGFTALAKREKL